MGIQPQGESTAIRGLGNFRDGAALSAVVAGTVGGLAVLAMARVLGLAPSLGAAMVPLVAAGVIVAARLMWRRIFRRESALLHVAVDEAAAVLAARRPEPAGDVSPAVDDPKRVSVSAG